MHDFRLREFDLERDYDAALALWSNAGPGFAHRAGGEDSLAYKLIRDSSLRSE